MPDDLTLAAVEQALLDNTAQAAREGYCRAAAEGFAAVGTALYVGGYFTRDDPTSGIALVAQMGGDLALGTVALLEQERFYTAAALTRQLVEVEYLLWTFSETPQDASQWLRASAAQLAPPLQAGGHASTSRRPLS